MDSKNVYRDFSSAMLPGIKVRAYIYIHTYVYRFGHSPPRADKFADKYFADMCSAKIENAIMVKITRIFIFEETRCAVKATGPFDECHQPHRASSKESVFSIFAQLGGGLETWSSCEEALTKPESCLGSPSAVKASATCAACQQPWHPQQTTSHKSTFLPSFNFFFFYIRSNCILRNAQCTQNQFVAPEILYIIFNQQWVNTMGKIIKANWIEPIEITYIILIISISKKN